MNINNFKHLIITLLLIAVICFTTDKIIFYILNKISDKVYTGLSVGKLNHYLKIKENKKLIIYGNSRANHNVDPKILDENSFNMGVDARDIAYVSTLIKTIENKEKQTLLIQIDPESIFNNNYTGDDISPLAVKYHRNDVIKKEIDKLKADNPFQHIFWSIAYNNKIIGIVQNYLKPKYNYELYNGFDPIDVDANQEKIFSKILSQEKTQKCNDSLNMSNMYFTYLLDLIDFAKKNNKEIIFFTAPIYKDICKEDNNELSNLAKNNHFKYFDFTDVFHTDNSLSYWKDETHLSRLGAEKFSYILKEKLSDNYEN